MNVKIMPGRLCGTVQAVSSKSHIQRLLLAAALSNGQTEISYCGLSEDINAMIGAICALGAKVEIKPSVICVQGITLLPQNPVIDAAESAATLRFVLPVAAAICDSASFCGRGRLPERPNAQLINAMRDKGAEFSAETLPFRINGRLKGGVYTLRADISSQYISGLLFALPLLCNDSEIRLSTSLKSAPYVDLTIDVLTLFGIEITKKDNSFFVIGNQHYSRVEHAASYGDWSNAAFWLTANAICGNIDVTGLTSGNSGDEKIVEILTCLSQEGDKTVDASQIPDLVPIISVYATSRNYVTKITGVGRLRLKESDRLKATASLICSLGGKAQETADGLTVYPCALSGGTVCAQDDHRIAMSAAIASLLCKESVIIEGAQAVTKSYPSFFEDFKKLGGEAHVLHYGK